MRNDRTGSSPPPEAPAGPPPRDQQRSSDIALVEIAKLQGDATNLRRDIDEARKDVREMRDRVIALEVKVDHLPGKGFIVAVVTSSLVIAGGFLAIIPRLQAVLAPPIVQSAPAPAAPPATPP